MVVLRRLDPTRNMARFYELSLQRSLFGETLLVRRWGRIGTYGRRTEMWFSDPGPAAEELQKFAARKLRRGYLRFA